MNNKILFAFSLFFSFFSSLATTPYTDKVLFMGSIQFPHTLNSIPGVRIYCKGTKIPCEVDNESKKVTFSISQDKFQTYFYVVITEDIAYEMSENNTVQYQKVQSKQPYKFYILELQTKKDSTGTEQASWKVRRQLLPYDTGRIPDQALIISYKPDYISSLIGGNELELPKIMIEDNVIEKAGSEEQLHDLSNALLLKALNSDVLYANISRTIEQKDPKIIVALDL